MLLDYLQRKKTHRLFNQGRIAPMDITNRDKTGRTGTARQDQGLDVFHGSRVTQVRYSDHDFEEFS